MRFSTNSESDTETNDVALFPFVYLKRKLVSELIN